MDNAHLSGLSVYAAGMYPVELSFGKRISASRRVPVRATVDVSTGEVSFYVDPAGIEVLRRDAGDH